MVSWLRRGHHFRSLAWQGGHQGHQRWGDRSVAQRMSSTFSRGWWWAPKMDNYMGLFNLLIQLNPPFSLVYYMFFIIFMLIEWIGLVIMPTSLMCALCSLFGQFGDKIKGFNEHLVAKFMGEQGRGFVGRCPLHLWALTSNSSPSARSSRATKSIIARATEQVLVKVSLTTSFGSRVPKV